MPSNAQLNLLAKLLDLPGVLIKDYQLHKEIGVIIHIEGEQQQAYCPKCGLKSDRLHQNHWHLVKDLPTATRFVYLRVNCRQFKCEKCQKPFSESLDCVGKNRNYTKRLAHRIIEEVLDSNIRSVARRNGLSEEEVQTMLKDVAQELLIEKPSQLRRLGMDEIALVKGQGNYCAVLVDIETRQLLAIVESRRIEDLRKVLQSWGSEILNQIEEVSIDLWKPYKILVQQLMPNADVVADRFHVMKQVNEELDEQRKSEKREAEALKKKTKNPRHLAAIKESKYALLKNEKDLNEPQKYKLKQVKKMFPKLATMQVLKEELREIFETAKNAEGLIKLLDWLEKSVAYFPKASQTIIRWFGEIVNYFDNRTTNGVVEGINNKLKLIKRAAYGFANFENFKLRSLLAFGSFY